MTITVSQLAKAINNKEHIKTDDIIRDIHVMVCNNTSIHYKVTDCSGSERYYNEQSVPVSIVRLMNYNKPAKAWKKENTEFFIYRF